VEVHLGERLGGERVRAVRKRREQGKGESTGPIWTWVRFFGFGAVTEEVASPL